MFENTYNILHTTHTKMSTNSTQVSNDFMNSIRTLTMYLPDIGTKNKYDELCDNFQSFLFDDTCDLNIKKMLQVLCVCTPHHTSDPNTDLKNFIIKALCYYKQFVIYCIHVCTCSCSNDIGEYTTGVNINIFSNELLKTNEHFIENIGIFNKFYEYVFEFISYTNFGSIFNSTRIIYETIDYYNKTFEGFEMSYIQMFRIMRKSERKEKYILKKCPSTNRFVFNNSLSPILEFVNTESGTTIMFDIMNMSYEIKSNFFPKIKLFAKCLISPLIVMVARIISLRSHGFLHKPQN